MTKHDMIGNDEPQLSIQLLFLFCKYLMKPSSMFIFKIGLSDRMGSSYCHRTTVTSDLFRMAS